MTLDTLQQQLAGLTEVVEGLTSSQTSLKKANDTMAKDVKAVKLQLISLQTKVNEAETNRDSLEAECTTIRSRIRLAEDQLANKIKSADIKISAGIRPIEFKRKYKTAPNSGENLHGCCRIWR